MADLSIRQEAYRLIDDLSEDGVKAIIEVMLQMSPERKSNIYETDKMKAFRKVQELRKITGNKQYTDIDSEHKESMV